uniref:Keratin-associated protein n=1 Tax=Castor canadensis TaxID=51338 RepID=A0A8C0WPB4_CASCN
MSYSCVCGNFSSHTLGGYVRYPVSSYNSVYPSNVIFSPRSYQLGSSLYDGQQEVFSEPTGSSVGLRSFQASCYHPKIFFFSSPYQTNYSGSLGYSNFGAFGYGNSGFPSLGCGSSFHHPNYFSSRSFQSSYYQPAFGSHFSGSSY